MSETENPVAVPATGSPEIPDEPLRRKFTVSMSQQEIEKEIDQLAVKYSVKVKIPGFRQGHVPVEVVKKTYRAMLLEEVIGEALSRLSYDSIKKEKWQIASQPVVDQLTHEDGSDMTAEMSVEVYPDIELPDLSTLTVAVPKEDKALEAFDEGKQIEALLEGHKRTIPVTDRGIADGDLVMIRLQNRIVETKRLSPRQSTYLAIHKENETGIENLDADLIGHQAGEDLLVRRTYAEGYAKKPWAGREVEHLIHIESVLELKRPELNDEFVKSIGLASVEDLKGKLQEEWGRQVARRKDDIRVRHLLEKLVETVSFPVPPGLVEHEMEHMLEHNRHSIQFPDEEAKEKFAGQLRAAAEKMVRQSLIVDRARQDFKIEIGEEDLKAEYQNLAKANGVSEKEIRRYFADKNKLAELKDRLLEPKVIQHLQTLVKFQEA